MKKMVTITVEAEVGCSDKQTKDNLNKELQKLITGKNLPNCGGFYQVISQKDVSEACKKYHIRKHTAKELLENGKKIGRFAIITDAGEVESFTTLNKLRSELIEFHRNGELVDLVESVIVNHKPNTVVVTEEVVFKEVSQ